MFNKSIRRVLSTSNTMKTISQKAADAKTVRSDYMGSVLVPRGALWVSSKCVSYILFKVLYRNYSLLVIGKHHCVLCIGCTDTKIIRKFYCRTRDSY